MARRSEIVDLNMFVHHETERAILASDDGDSTHAQWFPLSMVEVVKVVGPKPYWIVSMPEWLAI